MKMVATEHIAFGVENLDDAVDYYTKVIGFQETDRQSGWVELSSGPLKVYINIDDGNGPCLT